MTGYEPKRLTLVYPFRRSIDIDSCISLAFCQHFVLTVLKVLIKGFLPFINTFNSVFPTEDY